MKSALFIALVSVALTTGSGAAPAPASFAVPVTIVFPPKATARLDAQRRKMSVSVAYKGVPIASRRREADREDGTITLGEQNLEVRATTGGMRIPGGKVDRQRLAWVKRVDIEVYVTPPTMDLVCPTWDGSLAGAQQRGVIITCSVINLR